MQIKKIIISIAVIFICFTTLFSSLALAADIPLKVLVNNNEIKFPDAQPYVDSNGRTLVPVRFIGEKLGAEVIWDDAAKKATFILGNKKLILYIGNKEYDLNGTMMQMDTAAVFKQGRTFVPARYVAEAFGATVKWDDSTKTVYIAVNKDAVPIPETSPQNGTVKEYNGIKFNKVSDIDEYGRMSIEKSKEFLFKMVDQLTFVKEDGNFVIKGTYPEVPEGFQWSMGITVKKTADAKFIKFQMNESNPDYNLPDQGSFTKIVPEINSSSDVNFFYIGIAITTSKEQEKYMSGYLGSFQIVIDSTVVKRAAFVKSGLKYDSETYEDFDFDKMFQW